LPGPSLQTPASSGRGCRRLLHPANFMLEGEREPEVHKPRRLAVRAVVCRATLEQYPTRRPGAGRWQPEWSTGLRPRRLQANQQQALDIHSENTQSPLRLASVSLDRTFPHAGAQRRLW
jgi:hypothetical protein